MRQALAEDIGTGDVTTRSDRAGLHPWTRDPARQEPRWSSRASTSRARSLLPWAVTPCGSRRAPGRRAVAAATVLAEVEGPARALLTAERTALNLLQRMSGIATATPTVRGRRGRADHHPGHAQDHAHAARAGEIRRRVPAAAPTTASASTTSVSDQGQPRAAGRRRARRPSSRHGGKRRGCAIEVEAQSVAEAAEAADAGADIVLLDNLTTAEIREAVGLIGKRARTEISGGVTLARIPELAATGADFGLDRRADALGASPPDISFEIEPVGRSHDRDRPAIRARLRTWPSRSRLALGSPGLAPIGGDVLYFPVASSTNDFALRLAERGVRGRAVVIADRRPPDAAVAATPGFRRRARDCTCRSSSG